MSDFHRPGRGGHTVLLIYIYIYAQSAARASVSSNLISLCCIPGRYDNIVCDADFLYSFFRKQKSGQIEDLVEFFVTISISSVRISCCPIRLQ